MLTRQHAIVEYDRGRALPDRLIRTAHRHYLRYAEEMLAIYRTGVGLPRKELHRRVEAVFTNEGDCPVRRIQSFCKLLDDQSVYQRDPRGEASQLRLKLFAAAARFHPLVGRADRLFEHAETQAKKRLAAELGLPWPQIEAKLYADVMAYQRLASFDGYADGAALLSRYNVAQLQACLFRAERMTVHAAGAFKTILRYAKLARLLHEIHRTGTGRYRIDLSGPASVLRNTRRYGVSLARFLPALLACKGWRMSARLRTPWKAPAKLVVTDRDGFTSHLPPAAEFDSDLEAAFAAKFGRQRDGWRLIREGAILCDRQSVFIPDFVFRHEDGTQVLLEIVGFWTPEYLAGKRQTLHRFRQHRIVIALPERFVRKDVPVGRNVILYKTVLKVEPVLDVLAGLRASGFVGP